MKSKYIFIILLLSIITAGLVVTQRCNVQQPETTIRNAGKSIVTYRIIEEGSSLVAPEKTLRIGEIHRYQGGKKYTLTYQSAGESISWEMELDTPYVFRPDENDMLQIYPGSHSRSDAEDLAPYVATPMEVVEKMLAMVKIEEKDVLYDLGCGDGRIVIAAARKYKVRGVGIDIDPRRILECKENARIAGVKDRVTFIERDVLKVDISTATVVTTYLLPESNELLRPKLESQLKSGTPVITHNYPIPGWEAKERDYVSCKDKEGEIHTIYLYYR